MIDKIIGYTFLEINNKVIETRVNKYCFKYLKRLFGYVVESDHFIYERDDVVEDSISQNRIFFDPYDSLTVNQWDNIDEPVRFVFI
jgi:hypothetical protein